MFVEVTQRQTSIILGTLNKDNQLSPLPKKPIDNDTSATNDAVFDMLAAL